MFIYIVIARTYNRSVVIVKYGIRFGNYLFDCVGDVDRQVARKKTSFLQVPMFEPLTKILFVWNWIWSERGPYVQCITISRVTFNERLTMMWTCKFNLATRFSKRDISVNDVFTLTILLDGSDWTSSVLLHRYVTEGAPIQLFVHCRN